MVVVWGGFIYFVGTSLKLALAMRNNNARTSGGLSIFKWLLCLNYLINNYETRPIASCLPQLIITLNEPIIPFFI